ncbi:MAG: SOS response-associated peptidase [Gammaproteobacteria bacterium]|nr:SOS response-associated peptidase [Gammaproteobacteria bacterium]
MCGRFARYQPLSEWLEPLDMTAGSDLFTRFGARAEAPRYNIAPGTRTWMATVDAEGMPAVSEWMWAFPTRRGNRINVRSESAHRVAEYRPLFDRRRCVVFASGFYEPKGPKTRKSRSWYFFQPRDGSPLFFGGIVGDEGFAILTGAPAGPVARIHDRSPVMIPTGSARAWLDPDLSGREALQQFAPPAFGEILESRHVSDAAKNPAREGPELIAERASMPPAPREN